MFGPAASELVSGWRTGNGSTALQEEEEELDGEMDRERGRRGSRGVEGLSDG